MDLPHRLRSFVASKIREHDTIQRLTLLPERSLADLGITRDEIRPVARLASRVDPSHAGLEEVVAQVRQAEATRRPGSSRLLTSLGRAADRIAAREMVAEYQPRAVERLIADAHRARDEAVANLLRKAGGSIAAMVRGVVAPVASRIAASEPYRQFQLSRMRRREYQRLRTQLESYSDRELMADLRLVRSEIDEVAAEGAQRLVETVARDRRFRQATAWQNQTAS